VAGTYLSIGTTLPLFYITRDEPG